MGDQLAGCCGLAGWVGAINSWIRHAGTYQLLGVLIYMTNDAVDEQFSSHIERCSSSVQPRILVWLLFELRGLLGVGDLLPGTENIHVSG
jgi:hypothetical protein